MKLEIKNELPPLPLQSLSGLPDFVVITGLNGSGKSSLLKALYGEKCILTIDNNVKLKSLVFADSFTLRALPDATESYKYRLGLVRQADIARAKLLNHPNLDSLLLDIAQLETTLDFRVWGTKLLIFSMNRAQSAIRSQVGRGNRATLSIDELQSLDLTDHLSSFHLQDEQKGIGTDLLIMSDAYAEAQDENEYNRYRAEKELKTSEEPLSDCEFKKVYGPPPWELANRLLHLWNLDIAITEPIAARLDSRKKKASIQNKSTGALISTTTLSSGEKVLLTLLSEFYQASIFGRRPDVLLLDEPDAMLNPALSKKLVSMLKDTFCDELGVRVIMTTHSPTTVAAAPADSHYVMGQLDKVLRKSSTEEAIAQLFVGTPELTLLTENTKQVFCESTLDAQAYKELFGICRAYHSDKLASGNLNFLAFGKDQEQPENSNRNQVEELVSMLVKAGNPLAKGVVDWDLSRAADKKGVVVSLKDVRYSKENLIFDPFFLGLYLLKTQADFSNKLALPDEMTFASFSGWENKDKQTLVDRVCDVVKKDMRDPAKLDPKMHSIKYSDDEVLHAPSWWLTSNGHHLEDAIRKAFLRLNRRDDDHLAIQIINHINRETRIVVTDVINTFNKLLED